MLLNKESDVIELAALLIQHSNATNNNHQTTTNNKHHHNNNSISVKDFIPYYLLSLHSHSSWEKKILAALEKVKDLTRDEAQSRYLLIASTLPNYGITFFSGIIPKVDEECYIGVGKLGLALYKLEDVSLLAAYRFGYELRHYMNDGEAVYLTVKSSRHAEDKTVMVVSLQFAHIIELMGYYEKMKKFDKILKEQDDQDVQ